MEIFIAWIVSILVEQKINLSLIEKICKNKDYCGVAMPTEKEIY